MPSPRRASREPSGELVLVTWPTYAAMMHRKRRNEIQATANSTGGPRTKKMPESDVLGLDTRTPSLSGRRLVQGDLSVVQQDRKRDGRGATAGCISCDEHVGSLTVQCGKPGRGIPQANTLRLKRTLKWMHTG